MTQPSLAITTSILEPESALVSQCFHSLCVTTTREPFHSDGHEWLTRRNTLDDNLGVTGSLQWLYEHTTAPIIAFLHSDVELFERGWDERVLKEFDDPQVGVVGFGGGLQHGTETIYKTPYELRQLARVGYLSNTTDADLHGDRFEGTCDCAVLDGLVLVVRRDLLDRVGGWPFKECPFHSYDYWICITAHKLNYKVRLVGVHCHHHGGQTTTTPAYQEWSQRVLGKTDQQVHEESHRFIYEYGRGYLPWRCPEPALQSANGHLSSDTSERLSARRARLHEPRNPEGGRSA